MIRAHDKPLAAARSLRNQLAVGTTLSDAGAVGLPGGAVVTVDADPDDDDAVLDAVRDIARELGVRVARVDGRDLRIAFFGALKSPFRRREDRPGSSRSTLSKRPGPGPQRPSRGEERYRPELVTPPDEYRVAGRPQPSWLEMQIGARIPVPRKRSSFAKPLRLGEHMQLQVRKGWRAAVQDLENGQFLVSVLPEEALKPEMGFLPLLAPALIVQAVRKLAPQHKTAEQKLQNQRLLPGPVAEPEVLEPEVEGCGCGCGRCEKE